MDEQQKKCVNQVIRNMANLKTSLQKFFIKKLFLFRRIEKIIKESKLV